MEQNMTQKTIEAINDANALAIDHDHQALTPIHLALALFDDANGGIAQQAVLKRSGDETLR
jgi:ATP-dependent Clp protease ATP-binding subunit ClpA